MNRWILAAVGCGALASAALLGRAEAQSGPPAGTLTLVQRGADTRSGFVDNPPRRRESRGDIFTVTGPVRDASNRRAGTAQAMFVQTGSRTAQGSATFTLPAGRIVIAGGLGGRGDDTLAIAGGSGAYAGARGTARVREQSGGTEFVFTFSG